MGKLLSPNSSKYNGHHIKDVLVMVMVTPWVVCVCVCCLCEGDSLLLGTSSGTGTFLLCFLKAPSSLTASLRHSRNNAFSVEFMQKKHTHSSSHFSSSNFKRIDPRFQKCLFLFAFDSPFSSPRLTSFSPLLVALFSRSPEGRKIDRDEAL